MENVEAVLDDLRFRIRQLIEKLPKYKFTKQGYSNIPVKASGIYVISKERDIVYIGAAKLIKGRIAQHGHMDQFWISNQQSNLPYNVLSKWHSSTYQNTPHWDFEEWIRSSREAASTFKRLLKSYRFSFLVCREEYRYVVESLALSEFKTKFNSRGY